MAPNSPEWTRRYTVIFDTRIIVATSETVRNLTSLRGVSAAIPTPLPARSRARLTGFGAPVTYVSRVSRARKRARDDVSRSLGVPAGPGHQPRRKPQARGVFRS